MPDETPILEDLKLRAGKAPQTSVADDLRSRLPKSAPVEPARMGEFRKLDDQYGIKAVEPEKPESKPSKATFGQKAMGFLERSFATSKLGVYKTIPGPPAPPEFWPERADSGDSGITAALRAEAAKPREEFRGVALSPEAPAFSRDRALEEESRQAKWREWSRQLKSAMAEETPAGFVQPVDMAQALDENSRIRSERIFEYWDKTIHQRAIDDYFAGKTAEQTVKGLTEDDIGPGGWDRAGRVVQAVRDELLTTPPGGKPWKYVYNMAKAAARDLGETGIVNYDNVRFLSSLPPAQQSEYGRWVLENAPKDDRDFATKFMDALGRGPERTAYNLGMFMSRLKFMPESEGEKAYAAFLLQQARDAARPSKAGNIVGSATLGLAEMAPELVTGMALSALTGGVGGPAYWGASMGGGAMAQARSMGIREDIGTAYGLGVGILNGLLMSGQASRMIPSQKAAAALLPKLVRGFVPVLLRTSKAAGKNIAEMTTLQAGMEYVRLGGLYLADNLDPDHPPVDWDQEIKTAAAGVAESIGPLAMMSGIGHTLGAAAKPGEHLKAFQNKSLVMVTKLRAMAENKWGTFTDFTQRNAQKAIEAFETGKGDKTLTDSLLKRLIGEYDKKAPEEVAKTLVSITKQAATTAQQAHAVESAKRVAEADPAAQPFVAENAAVRQQQLKKVVEKASRGEPVEVPVRPKAPPPTFRIPADGGQSVETRDVSPRLDKIEDLVSRLERDSGDYKENLQKLKSFRDGLQVVADNHPEMHTLDQWQAIGEAFDNARDRLVQLGKMRKDQAEKDIGGAKIKVFGSKLTPAEQLASDIDKARTAKDWKRVRQLTRQAGAPEQRMPKPVQAKPTVKPKAEPVIEGRIVEKRSEYGASNTLVTRSQAAKDVDLLKKAFSEEQFGAGAGGLPVLKPEVLAALVRVGTYHFEAGIRSFPYWSERMIAEVGKRVQPHLKKVWEELNDLRWEFAAKNLRAFAPVEEPSAPSRLEAQQRLARIDAKINLRSLLESANDKLDAKKPLTPEEARAMEYSKTHPYDHIVTPAEQELLDAESIRAQKAKELLSGLKEEQKLGRPDDPKLGTFYDVGLETYLAGERETFESWSKATGEELLKRKLIAKVSEELRSNLKDMWDRMGPTRKAIADKEETARVAAIRRVAEGSVWEAPLSDAEVHRSKLLITEVGQPTTLGQDAFNRIKPGMSARELKEVSSELMRRRDDMSDADRQLLRPKLEAAAFDVYGGQGAKEFADFILEPRPPEPRVEAKPSMTMDELYDFTMAETVANMKRVWGEGALTEVAKTSVEEGRLIRSKMSPAARKGLQYVEHGRRMEAQMQGLTPEEIFNDAIDSGNYVKGIQLMTTLLQRAENSRDKAFVAERDPYVKMVQSRREMLKNLEEDNKVALQRQLDDSIAKLPEKDQPAAKVSANEILASDRRTSEISEAEAAFRSEIEGFMQAIDEEADALQLAVEGPRSEEPPPFQTRRFAGVPGKVEPMGVVESSNLSPEHLDQLVAGYVDMIRTGALSLKQLIDLPEDVLVRVKANLNGNLNAVDNLGERFKVESADRIRKSKSISIDEMKRLMEKSPGYMASAPGVHEVAGLIEATFGREHQVDWDADVFEALRSGRLKKLSEPTPLQRWSEFLREGLHDDRLPKWRRILSKTAAGFGRSFRYEWDVLSAPDPEKIIDILRVHHGNDRLTPQKVKDLIDGVLNPLWVNHRAKTIPRGVKRLLFGGGVLPAVYDEFCSVVMLRDLIESWGRLRAIDVADAIYQIDRTLAEKGGEYADIEPIIQGIRSSAENIRKVLAEKGEEELLKRVESLGERALVPQELSLDNMKVLYRRLRLDAAKKAGMEDALRNHERLVKAMGAELEAQGILEKGSSRTFYFPHQVKEFVNGDTDIPGPARGAAREPNRGYAKARKGSEKPYEADYVTAMARLLGNFYRDQNVHNTLVKIAREYSDWNMVDANTGRPAKGWRYYDLSRGVSMRQGGERWAGTLERLINDELMNSDLPKNDARLKGFEIWRNRLLAKGTIAVLPESIVYRLDHLREHEPDTLVKAIRTTLGIWKGAVIFSTLGTFLVNQIIGDTEMQFAQSARSLKMLPEAAWELHRIRHGKRVPEQVREEFRNMERYMVMESGMAVAKLDLNRQFPQFYDRPLLVRAWDFWAAVKGHLMNIASEREGFNRVALYKWLTKTEEGAKHLEKHFPQLVDQLGATAVRYTEEVPTTDPKTGKPSTEKVVRTKRLILGGEEAKVRPGIFESEPEITLAEVEKMRKAGIKVEEFRDISAAAAKVARESMVDYSALPPFEQNVMRGFLVPFYPYYRYNLQNWAKLYSSRRWPMAVFKALAPQIMLQLWNQELHKDDEDALADWQRSGPHFIVPWVRGKDGLPLCVSFQLPSQDVISMVRDPVDTLMRLLTPPAKLPYGWLMGRDPASGFPIVEGDMAKWTAEQILPTVRKWNASTIEERKQKLVESWSDAESSFARTFLATFPVVPYYGAIQRINPDEAWKRNAKVRDAWNASIDEAKGRLLGQVRNGRYTMDEIRPVFERLTAAKRGGPPDKPEHLYGEIRRIFEKLSEGDYSPTASLWRWADAEYREQAAEIEK